MDQMLERSELTNSGLAVIWLPSVQSTATDHYHQRSQSLNQKSKRHHRPLHYKIPVNKYATTTGPLEKQLEACQLQFRVCCRVAAKGALLREQW